MRQDLDEALCAAYPKLFRNRFKPPAQTNMCWGFAHGDGWYKLVETLCSNIQTHIDWKRQQRANALRYNRALSRAVRNNSIDPLIHYYTLEFDNKQPSSWMIKNAEEALTTGGKPREVPQRVNQVVVDQVKEKFGTLRFYYHGGDKEISGMVRMAESMSAHICEQCGSPGTTGGKTWINTLCNSCRQSIKEV